MFWLILIWLNTHPEDKRSPAVSIQIGCHVGAAACIFSCGSSGERGSFNNCCDFCILLHRAVRLTEGGSWRL